MNLNSGLRPFVIKGSMILAFLILSSCSKMDLNSRLVKTEGISPMTTGQPFVLNAEQVVLILKASGLGDEDIIAYGPDVRRIIAGHGGVFVKKDGVILAAVAVIDNLVYISVNDGRNFTIDI
mgnify:CR=1 FL=1